MKNVWSARLDRPGPTAQLVPLFRSRVLPAETLQSLQLLARAVARQHLDASLLGKLRDKLLGVQTPTIPMVR